MDTFRSSDCSTTPDEITATGRILVIGPPRSGTTWVEQVLGVPPLDADATPLQRLAWQVGVFISALESAVQRNPGWLAVSHEALCADPPGGFKGLCAGLGVPWTGEAAGFPAASDRPGKGLETRRVAAEQPSNWSRQLSAAQVDEAVGVLSAFPDRLFGPASVP